MAKESDKPAKEVKVAGPELRLVDRRAFVGFPPVSVAPGLSITDFALQIPDVTFPFNVTGGASRYQRKKLHFGYLELSVDAELVARKVSEVATRLSELNEVKLHFRPGYLEGQARMRGPERAPLTFKVAFDGDGEKLAVYLYDVRLYSFCSTPAAQVPVLISRALSELTVLPEVEPRGANGFTTQILPPLVQLAAVGRGYKMPVLDQARLAGTEVSTQGLRLRFAAGGLPPPATPDEELLLTLEGARAFSDAEELIAQGKLHEAREAFLRLGDASDAHPFAAERLLTLLVADPQAHELALDLAGALARRRDRSAAALWAEAVVRERRGEFARAAERYLALCGLSRRNQEDAAAFFAAESAARAARDHAPQMAVKALHELLGLKPDHLPSLKALARASDQARDRAGAIRAYRRIAALARDPAEAAEAHVHMARLCAETEDDVAGARLHCEAALRLAPDHPEALYQLAELCHKGGEHLRAIRALDRLREVALGRHEVDRIGRANLLAGQIWEAGLDQPENALLRYREAIALLPGEPVPLFRAAQVAERLGKLQEAIAGYQQAIELAGPAPRSEEIRRAAHASHHALARIHRTRLGDPARAREHLEAAFALDPADMAAIEELLPYFRATGRAAELADACEKAAAVLEDPPRRAAFWAEAGELYRGRLGQPDKAERLLTSALEADPRNRIALEGMLALAESRRDGGQLCRCLKALSELSADPKNRVRYCRRLAVAARDLAFDLDLAASALSEVLKIEPDDLPTLGELCALQRKRADMGGLAVALEQRAAAAERHGDKRLAAAALRELGQILEVRLGRVGEALVALEKAARLSPDPAVLLDLANLSLRCERPQHARRALEDLLSSLPKHTAPERVAEIRALLGKSCDLLGDREGAREHYALAFPLRRLDGELAARLEALYQESGQLKELTELWAARAQALLAAGRPQEAAPLFLSSARALLDAGDRAAASLRLHAALDAAPEGEHAAEILEAMAELEVQRGERLEAAKLQARRAALLPDARAQARTYFKAATLAAGTPREAGYLAQALAQDSAFAPARIRRADLSIESDARAALADLEAALAGAPGDPDAPSAADRLDLLRRAGLAALRAGMGDTARRHLALYGAQRPDDLDVQRQLAQLHRKAGAKEALFELLAELWPRLSGSEQRAARTEYAELALELGRTAAAIDVLRTVRESDPSDAWAARNLLALLPADASHEQERRELLTVLIDGAEGDERAELLTRRGRIHRELGRLEQARADLLEAAAASTRPAPIFLELAGAAREAGDEVGELEVWTLAIRRAPELSDAASARLLALARSRLAADDVVRARQAFEAAGALPLAPADRCEAFVGLAAAAQRLGDLPAAAAAFQEAARQGPAPRRVEALLQRAGLLEQVGELPSAAQSYEAALALAPRHAKATAGLKQALRSLEDWSGLAEVLAAEAAHAPRASAAALFAELGALYLDHLDQLGPAEAAFRRAAQLDRANADVRRRLAALLADRGELAEAVRVLEEAAGALASDNRAAASLLREGVVLALKDRDGELALRLARKAHALSAAQGDDLVALADLLYLHGATREALPFVRQVAEAADFDEAPEVAEAAWLRLSDVAEALGEVELARTALQRLTQRRPFCTAAVERLAALVEREDPRAGIELLFGHLSQLAPSERNASVLLRLAERARTELADVELSARLLERAAELTTEPLPVHQALVELYRDAGRTQELAGALLSVADLSLERGEVDGAIAAYDEEAILAEKTGRVDEALRSLRAMAEICEDEGRLEQAAGYERRRAEVLRDAKLDLDAAEGALRKSFELHPALRTAQLGAALAQRRDDRDGEADWVERSLELYTERRERAAAFLHLAKLHLGISRAPDGLIAQLATAEGRRALVHGPQVSLEPAEAALREALRLDPALADADRLLWVLLEEQGRHADLAAYQEETALRQVDPGRRAALLMKAAQIYSERAGKPHAAAAALLAARAAMPDDLALTARAADMLHEIGRRSDAAEFDALLLEADPFHPAFERHAAHLTQSGDLSSLAALLLRRAERQEGAAAAETLLQAAAVFRRAGAEQQALLCEDQAFDQCPAHDRAFEVMRARYQRDLRRLSEVLEARARAIPGEAVALLRERAQGLADAGEALLAAAALDDLLEVAPEDVTALSTRAELAAGAGGPKAAQPYDRRLLASGVELPRSARVKVQLRLGHAALESGAYQDAADAFEAVIALEPDGEKGREALSLLSEVHARTRNARGVFDTTLKLARAARPDEAEALLRRAAELFEDPREGIEALLPLARMRPSDLGVVDRAVAGLKALGRHTEVIELCQRCAEAIGGPAAAEWLLAAASVAEERLDDRDQAAELRQRAAHLDPGNPVALRAIAEQQRKDGNREGLLGSLDRLIAATSDADEASLFHLERGELLAQAGDAPGAREAFEAVVARGSGAAGYTAALEALPPILRALGDDAALSRVLGARAELLGGADRAGLLLEAAQAAERAGDAGRVVELCRASAAARPAREAMALLARTLSRLGRSVHAAAAWIQAAQLAAPEEQGKLLLEAVEAFEAGGERAEARDVLARIAADHPALLPPAELAARFERLGAATDAARHGFAPALAAGELTRALALAEAAGDAEGQRQALWALTSSDPAGPHAERLAAELRGDNDLVGLERLAGLWKASGSAALSRGQADVVFDTLCALEEAGRSPGELWQVLLDPELGLSPERREQVLERAAEVVPSRRRAIWRELYELRRAAGRHEAAADALERLAAQEDDPRARSAVHLELGELYLHALAQPQRAREAFELALTGDLESVAAVKHLLPLYVEAQKWDRLVAMAERLTRMLGPEAVAPYRESLAEAYERLGRREDAYRLLGELPENEERLRRRARLARELGLNADALQLEEQLATEPSKRVEVFLGYARAGLVPFAVRLGQSLLADGALPPDASRVGAERLIGSVDGAPFGIRLWCELLRRDPVDADGWTLLAEGLRRLDRGGDAELVDGFGAALSLRPGVASSAPMRPLRISPSAAYPPAPAGLIDISPDTMPRLHRTLSSALTGLGAGGVQVLLHASGGVEAYRIGPDALVLGAGALACFGPAELTYLVALALALGEAAERLARPGAVDGFEAAAVEAFTAFRASLAASRVLAHLDPRVRGGDPMRVRVPEVLSRSAAFHALALQALDWVEAGSRV